MRKWILLILAATMMAIFSGCESAAPIETNPLVSVEERVLFEKPYAKFSSVGITREGENYILELAVQNNGTEDLWFTDEVVCVNGLSVPFQMELAPATGTSPYHTDTIPDRTSGTLRLYLDCATMFLWGMDKVESISLRFGVHTKYSHEILSETVMVEEAGVNATLSADGETILEENGVTVQYKIVNDWPAYLLVNSTEYPVMVKTKEMTFNGFSEYYSLNPDWIWAEPGQTIVSVPVQPDSQYIPPADTLEIGFQVRVVIDGDGYVGDDILSEVATYEAPFFINNDGVNPDFYTAYEDDRVCVRLGSQQRSVDKAEDLCFWIENKTDQDLHIYATKVIIDGRTIPVYESDKNKEQCFYNHHTLYPHTKEIKALTSGDCGTPEMYGGIQEVEITFSIQFGDADAYDTVTVTVPFA